MGEQDDIATVRLRYRLLQEHHLDTRPREERPGPTAVHGRPPIHLGIMEHLKDSVQEVIDHGRAVAPDAGPAPHDGAVYEWMREHTAHLEPEKADVGRAIVYRQALEHAIIAGDASVIRQEPCPSCGCWGVAWHPGTRRAVCINQRCLTDGVPSAWSLKQLAEHAVRRGAIRRTGTI